MDTGSKAWWLDKDGKIEELKVIARERLGYLCVDQSGRQTFVRGTDERSFFPTRREALVAQRDRYVDKVRARLNEARQLRNKIREINGEIRA